MWFNSTITCQDGICFLGIHVVSPTFGKECSLVCQLFKATFNWRSTRGCTLLIGCSLGMWLFLWNPFIILFRMVACVVWLGDSFSVATTIGRLIFLSGWFGRIRFSLWRILSGAGVTSFPQQHVSCATMGLKQWITCSSIVLLLDQFGIMLLCCCWSLHCLIQCVIFGMWAPPFN